MPPNCRRKPHRRIRQRKQQNKKQRNKKQRNQQRTAVRFVSAHRAKRSVLSLLTLP